MINFRERVEAAWCKNSSYCPEDWGSTDEAWGQCAVTAVLLQEVWGGELVRGWAVNEREHIRTRHYWNHVNGIDVDLTWRQFPVGTTIQDREIATYADLVANKWMEERLNTLRVRFMECAVKVTNRV